MGDSGWTYRGFMSYSHRDRRVADRLHRKLEGYRTPKRLVGTPGRDGPVPSRVSPIFRDREELPTSADLGEMIREALAGSRYLIVVCSPRSARSRWVNEEVLTFKRLGGDDRVLAIIVDGEPNASDHPDQADEECFPPALRYEVGPDGELTDERAEPIAADAREIGDGPADARLKLLAGLLGVGFDQLKRREAARRQKRLAISAGVLGVVAAIMLALTVFALISRADAIEQRGIANERTRQSLQRLSDNHVQQGDERYLAGDITGAFLHYVHALRVQPEGADSEHVHRVRLASVSRRLPRLETAHLTGSYWDPVISRDGRLVMVCGQSPRLIDVATGDEHGLAVDGDVSVDQCVWGANDACFFTVRRGWLERWDRDGTRTHQWAFPEREHSFDDMRTIVASADGAVILARQDSDGLVLSGGDEPGVPNAITMDERRELRLGPQGLRFATFEEDAASYDVADGRMLARFDPASMWRDVAPALRPEQPRLWVGELEFDPTGQYIATATPDGLLQVWEVATGRAITWPQATSIGTTAVALPPESPGIIFGDEKGNVRIWRTDASRVIVTGQRHHSPVNDIVFDPELELLASSGSSFVELEAAGVTTRVTPGGTPEALRIRDDGTIVVLASRGYQQLLVQTWSLPAGPGPLYSAEHADRIMHLQTLPGSPRIVTATEGGLVRATDAENGQVLGERTFDGAVSLLRLSPDGERVVVISAGMAVWLRSDTLETVSGPVRVSYPRHPDSRAGWQGGGPEGQSREIDGPSDAIVDMVFDETGERCVMLRIPDGGGAQSLYVWEPASGQEPRWIDVGSGPDGWVSARHLGWVGGEIVFVDWAGSLRRIDPTTLSEQTPVVLPADAGISAVTVAPDGERILMGASDGSVHLLERDGSELWRTKTAREGWVTSLSFSSDGARVLVSTSAGWARILDAATGEPESATMNAGTSVSGARLQGGLVMTTSTNAEFEQVARLWDARSGAEGVVDAYTHELVGLALDGNRLVAVEGQTLQIWDTAPLSTDADALLRRAERLAVRRIDLAGAVVLLSDEELYAAQDVATVGPSPPPTAPTAPRTPGR